MFCAQAGLFKIEEYDDSNVLNKKMITIKNLKYTGTAPQRGWGEFSTLLWNGPMIDSRSNWVGANTDTLAGTGVIGRYNYNAYRGSLSIDKPATNLTLENLFVSRNRCTEGPRYNGYTGLLVPEGFPGSNGTLVVDTVYCKLRDASFNSHFHTVFPENFGISRVYQNTPVPKSITVKNVIADWRVDNFLWIGQSNGTPNSNRALKGQSGRNTWYDGYWRPYAYDYKVNTQDAFAPNSGDSAARIFANSTGWLFRTMPTSNLAETFIVQNNYAIDVSGNIDRNPSGTSSGAYPNTSLVNGITWTSRDASTLIPTFQTFPFSGYSNLTDVPIIQPAVGGSWYSLTTIHVDYDDVYGMDLKQFLTDLNGVTSHLKGYLTIAAKVDKGRYVLLEFLGRTDNTSYATIDVNTISVSSGSYSSSSGDIFANNENCLIEFTRSGDRGAQGYQGFTGYQGFQGAQGFTGFQGVQGSTLAWWNSFKLNYDNTSFSGSGILTGEWRPGDNLTTLANEPYLFSQSSNNYDKISLEGWVELGILRKTVNDPAVGRTTYKMIRDVTIDTTKSASLGSWWENVPNPYVSGVNGTYMLLLQMEV